MNDETWWTSELQAYRDVGVRAEWLAVASDPWKQDSELENNVRTALGLPLLSESPGSERRYILLESDAPRARQWARLQALWLTAQDGTRLAVVEEAPADTSIARVSTDIKAESFAAADALPRCHPGRLRPDAGHRGHFTVFGIQDRFD